MKRTSSSPARFSDLFSQSVDIAKGLWAPVIAGTAVCFGAFIILLVLTIFAVGLIGPVSIPDPTQSVTVTDLLLLLVLLVFVTLMIFLGWASSTYNQILAVERIPRMRDALKRVPSSMIPLAYAGVWMFIRTWSWVPLFLMLPGVMLASGNPTAIVLVLALGLTSILACFLVFAPRVALAPVIVIKERVSPLESVRLSEKRTRGYWPKVLCDVLLLVIVLWILSFGMQMLFAGLVGSFEQLLGSSANFGVQVLGVAGFLFLGLLLFIMNALLQFVPLVFWAQLHATLKEHPRK